MGFFSRKEPSADSSRRSSTRTSSEAQAAELRVRARRRLIGALVLVLTAVIFVPMLFDSPPEEELPSPVVLPEPIPPIPAEPQVALAPEPVTQTGSGDIEPLSPEPEAPAAIQQPEPVAPQAPSEPEPPKQAEAPAPKPEKQPEPAKPAPSKPAAPAGRTDDGSVALALLEGRQPAPAASAPATQGSVVLQVAAYTTEADAQSRRDKLVAAGVTNAYVEQAVANGKTAYRLRVGPFPTRDAAEAAQARLRQLGYNNGLIFTK